MTEKNNKVPIAILSCFLIAFILQGVLKISGILVFEKALDWEIFNVIDKYKVLQIIMYSTFNVMTVYCMSFALTTKPYSKKWYHYIIILISSYGVTIFRMFATYTQQINIIIDVLLYVVIPFIVYLTIPREDRAFENNLFGVVTTLSLNIFMYLAYLGLQYWSAILNSLLPINTAWLLSSANFLIQLEVYIGLITFMLSSNMLINKIKEKK